MFEKEVSLLLPVFPRAKTPDPTLLPDQPGAHRHLLLQPTKGSMIYVIDRDRMGKFQPNGDAVVQRVRMAGLGLGAMGNGISSVMR